MRRLLLASLTIVCTACTVRVPRTPGLRISIPVRAKIHVEGRVDAAVPVPPPAAVELQGAAVVEFFGIPLEDAQDVVFVLDRSGSMSSPATGRLAQINIAEPPPADAPPPVPDPYAPPPPPVDAPPPAPVATATVPPPGVRKIDVAQYELVDALRRLPPGTRLNVVFFNDELEAFAPDMVPLDEPGREGLVGFVRETTPNGRTALTPAMRVAFLMNARRIVLLSDGLGNVGGNASALLRDAREAIRGGVRIDTVGLGSDQDASLLQTLATESGGLYQPL